MVSGRNVFYIFAILVLAIGGIFADGAGMKTLGMLMYAGIVAIMVYAAVRVLRTGDWQ